MKKAFLLVSVLFLAGCVSTKLPQYLSDVNPYKKEFYAPFAQAAHAAQTALTEAGWKISGEGNPSVYEQSAGQRSQETILFTEVRQTPLFLGSRYYKVNVILRSNDTMTEVEIRYLTITAVPFKNIESYRNDKAVEKLFERIAELLKK